MKAYKTVNETQAESPIRLQARESQKIGDHSEVLEFENVSEISEDENLSDEDDDQPKSKHSHTRSGKKIIN